MTAPLTTCSRPGCTLPASFTLAEHGQYNALCIPCYEAATSHGAVVRGSDGRRYEIVADSLDLEVGELRRENARLLAKLQALEAQGQGAK